MVIERRDAKEDDRKTRKWMHERTNHKYVTGTGDGKRQEGSHWSRVLVWHFDKGGFHAVHGCLLLASKFVLLTHCGTCVIRHCLAALQNKKSAYGMCLVYT